MKICYFGIFDPTYARNRILIQGWEKNGFEVVLCRVDPKIYKGLSKFTQLYREYKKLLDQDFTYVIVGFPGHPVVWFARILFGRKILFDAFVSLYNSNVYDRKLYSALSPRAFKDWFLDFYSFHTAHRVFFDTYEHISYVSKKFWVHKKRFVRVMISADEKIFYPRDVQKGEGTFIVNFHGSYIPLQGVEFIVQSAIILKNEQIKFRFIGSALMHKDIRASVGLYDLKNIELVDRVPFSDIPNELAKAHVCLGIFGVTDKAQRVIPNKVYEGVAMGMPVITMDSAAIRELFTDRKNILLCKSGDPVDLARSIMELKNNPILCREIGIQARNLFEKELVSEKIVRNLLNELQ